MIKYKYCSPIRSALIHPWLLGAAGLGLLLFTACGGGGGGSSTPASPTITSFTASPTTARTGANVTFTGVFANGTGIITPGNRTVTSGTGVTIAAPAATTTYTLTVTGAAATTPASLATTVTVAASGAISGTALVTYLPLDSSQGKVTPDPQQVPVSYATDSINAILVDGTVYPGSYDPATGAYTVPDVPGGPCWLQAGSSYIWTSQSSVDLGYAFGGRRGMTRATSSTPVVFNTAGMAPWNTSNDYLVFFDYNTNNVCYPPNAASSGYPTSGATALSGLTVDWYQNGLNLVDTSKGDYPRFYQMVGTLDSTTHEFMQVASKFLFPITLSMANGGSYSVGGTFFDGVQDPVVVNYSRSSFAANRSYYNPTGSLWGSFFEIDTQPGAKTYGDMGQWADLLYSANATGTLATNAGPIAATIPRLPDGFDPIAYAGDSYGMTYTLPGASNSIQFKVYAQRTYATTLPDATHPIEPLLSPVQNPTITTSGVTRTLFSDQSGVGLTPTIAWTAPAQGTPQGYGVHLYRLFLNGTSTNFQQVAVFSLDGTQTAMTFPSGVLSAGQYYFILLRAMQDSTYDPTSAPFQVRHFPYGRAEMATNMFTP